MTDAERRTWDERYAAAGLPPLGELGPPPTFAGCERLFPGTGHALELACGRGRCAVWLAGRGMTVEGVDISPTAIDLARQLATRERLDHRCSFAVRELDRGLPSGPPVDLLLNHLYWNPDLVPAMRARLAPGGLIAVAVLSEVDVGPGAHRVQQGALVAAFEGLAMLEHGESDGKAWLVGRNPASR